MWPQPPKSGPRRKVTSNKIIINKMLDPVDRRRVQPEDLQAIAVKFKHSAINKELVTRQAVTYSFDDSLDLPYTDQCGKSAVKFFMIIDHSS